LQTAGGARNLAGKRLVAQMIRDATHAADLVRVGAAPGSSPSSISTTTVALYLDPQTGATMDELIQRALANNGELIAAQSEIGRSRARLRQAGLRPNPTVNISQGTGNLTGAPGEWETEIGITLPLEVGGQRGRRIDLARVELEAAEAEFADRERRLTNEVLNAYGDALANLRELEITENLTALDLETVKFVQIRVNEGESPPLELNLLQVEVERLRSRHALIEGRVQTAIFKLKSLAGIPLSEPLRLRESLSARSNIIVPATAEAATDIALRSRPDLRLARVTEEAAAAGLKLVKAQSRPELAATVQYSAGTSVFNNTPVGTFRDQDRLLTFGASLDLPVFNRNQGRKEEAALAIVQAKQRREFLEQIIKNELASAYAQYGATEKALSTLELGVITRAQANVETMRAAYQLGQFSITELLAEQRRLLDSQRDYTEALVQRYRALVQIQIALGIARTR
jgi:cobalt-zinc-cadmium efflux system outer membrane protein